MGAIERIAGYACEVNEEQWRELVKVAESLSVSIDDHYIDFAESNHVVIAEVSESRKTTIGFYSCATLKTLIPYPDFLAKLKGDEKWEPKNGEQVEVWCSMTTRWMWSKFIGVDSDKDVYVCLMYDNPSCSYTAHKRADVKPVQSITRAEAEHALGKRIVD